MKKTLIILALLLITGCTSNNLQESPKETPEVLILVYCPTMKVHLEHIEDPNIIFVEVPTTQMALELLSTNKANIAFVGRLAYPLEVPHKTKQRVLFDRFTITSQEGNPIQISDLKKEEIYTQIIPEKLEEFDYLNFVNESEKVNEKLVLIKWSNFNNSLALVNVMSGLEKVEIFRNPTLYYFEEHEEKVSVLAEKIVNKNQKQKKNIID